MSFCPNCGNQLIDGANFCMNCGLRINNLFNQKSNDCQKVYYNPNVFESDSNLLDSIYNSENGDKVKMIRKLSQIKQLDLKSASEQVEEYLKFKGLSISKTEIQKIKLQQKKFDGVYRYGLLGGKTEVYCPRCASSNCSHYKEQKVIPGKTKTTYSANINPLKPFTLVNKKEKVVRKDQVITENKFICNSCGKIFN